MARRRLRPDDRTLFEPVPATELRIGDVVLVDAGDIIPSDGDVIEGMASVNESAVTGESAPVIREAGGDRSAVTGGTTLVSDWLVVRITAAAGATFLDRMIRLVEGAERRKTPNEIALDILLAGMTIIFRIAVVTLVGFVRYSDTVSGVPVPYKADASNASNLGPTSKALVERVRGDIGAAGPQPVPADAVTTSASGLDPHISPQNALRQVEHVAAARGMAAARVRALVEAEAAPPALGFIGQPRVNLLRLNLALDAAEVR
jgi:hypothetical protein